MENDERTYYVHSAQCSRKDFETPNARGLRRCIHCSGIFNAAGEGVTVTDTRSTRIGKSVVRLAQDGMMVGREQD